MHPWSIYERILPNFFWHQLKGDLAKSEFKPLQQFRKHPIFKNVYHIYCTNHFTFFYTSYFKVYLLYEVQLLLTEHNLFEDCKKQKKLNKINSLKYNSKCNLFNMAKHCKMGIISSYFDGQDTQ